MKHNIHICSKIFSLLTLLNTCSCVSIQQQLKPSHQGNLKNYEAYDLIINKVKFSETLNPDFNDRELLAESEEEINRLELMEKNFQCSFDIKGYGIIYTGELIEKHAKC